MTTDHENRVIVLSTSEDIPNLARNLTAARLIDILDLAETGNTRDLFALYRDVLFDSHIQAEFTKRKAAVLGDVRNLIPYDRKRPEDAATKDFCFSLIESDDFYSAIDWLLNATLFPVAVVEKVFVQLNGTFRVHTLRAVPFQLLDLSDGTVRIFDVIDGHVQSTSRPADPDRYIIHRGHNLPVPDRWGGPMRAILAWWALRTFGRGWWANLMERFGTPFLKGEYKTDDGRRALISAFAMASRLGGIAYSAGTRVEMERASAGDTTDAHERFIQFCNAEISKLIVGQTLSSTPSPTGELGAGTANLQGGVRDDLRRADATALAMTIRGQLLSQLCRINGLAGRPPIVLFGADSSADILSSLRQLQALGQAGLEPDDDGLSALAERVGYGLRRKQSPSSVLPMSAAVLPPFRDLSAVDPRELLDRALARYS